MTLKVNLVHILKWIHLLDKLTNDVIKVIIINIYYSTYN